MSKLKTTRGLPPHKILKAALAWIPFILSVPFAVAVLLTLCACKGSVLILRRLLKRQDLISPVSGHDVMFSTDEFFKSPRGSLAFIWFIDGTLSHDVVLSRLKEALLTSAKSSRGRGENSVDGYEKLTSVYPIFWMGYPFWKKADTEFNVANHVKLMKLNGSISCRPDATFIARLDDVNKFICEWMAEPFAEGQPLWEIRIVPKIAFLGNVPADLLHQGFPGTQPPTTVRENACESGSGGGSDALSVASLENNEQSVKSILILKTHHMLGDGNSMLRVLDKIIDPPLGPFSSTCYGTDNKSKHSHEESTKPCSVDPPLLDEKLQRYLNEYASKVEEGVKGGDQQKGKHQETKSSVFTATYICPEEDNAAQAIKVGSEPGRARRCATKEPGRVSFLWWQQIKVKLRLLWHQLSSTIYFAFFIPPSLFTLVYAFSLHRDCWFTQRKDSARVNLASVGLPMARLNKIRTDLCKKRILPVKTPPSFTYSDGNRCSNGNEGCNRDDTLSDKVPNEGGSASVPVIVIASAALAAAFRRLLLPKGKKLERKVGGNTSKSNHLSYRCDKESGSKFSQNLVHKPISPSLNCEQEAVNFVLAVPLQKQHPGRTKFCNFWTHGILQANIAEADIWSSLHQLNSQYWEMRCQQSPEIYYYLTKIFFLFPHRILSLVSGYNVGAPIGITNMADSAELVYVGGQKVLRKYAYFGLQWKHASLTMTLLSYNGEMTISILAHESVIPDQKTVEKLLHQYFLDEIELLEKGKEESDPTTSLHSRKQR